MRGPRLFSTPAGQALAFHDTPIFFFKSFSIFSSRRQRRLLCSAAASFAAASRRRRAGASLPRQQAPMTMAGKQIRERDVRRRNGEFFIAQAAAALSPPPDAAAEMPAHRF